VPAPDHVAVAASSADSIEAARELDQMLAGFSGEALDYFDTVRAALAAVLDAPDLARLEQHLSRYEFEEARALLPQALLASHPDTAENP
jgi:hypothetical protein